MKKSSSPGCKSRDSSLFKTGMFLRPHIASSLQSLIHGRTIHDRAKFSVIKSQVHPDGLCEIFVKKLDPSVSIGSIMELLKHCRDLVQEHCPNINSKGPDLNSTVYLSDSDDSICVVSSPHYSERMVSFKRTLSASVECTSESSCNQLSSKPLPNKLNTIKKSKLVLDIVESRKVSLINNESKDLKSSKTNIQGHNIVVQVTNKVDPSPSVKSDSANTSVDLVDVSENDCPSETTWINPLASKFPLAKISRNLGEILAKNDHLDKEASFSGFNDLSNKTVSYQQQAKAGQKNCTEMKVFPKRCFSDVLEGIISPDLSANEPVKTLDEPSNKTQICEKIARNDSSCLSQKDKKEESEDSGNEPKTVGLNEDSSGTGSGPNQCIGASEQMSTSSSNIASTTSLVKIPDSAASVIEKNESNEESTDDDEIIIEKEFKNNKLALSRTLTIDDSDDDIAVCEVVKTTNANRKLEINPTIHPGNRQKKKLKKLKNPYKIPAGSTFVASTSNGPAPDFIPLKSSFRRIDPKTSNCPKNCPKNSEKLKKIKKIDRKKLKKDNALKTGKPNGSSSDVSNKAETNKEKREFGANILNPNSGQPKTGLRPIVIDASNVAIGHGKSLFSGKPTFSVPGLKICIKYFSDKGHKVIAFAPKYRRFQVSPEDRKALDELETAGILSFTPSRTLENGLKLASYDDRYVVQLAAELGGIIVSTDNYRDLLSENESWRETIEQRLLMFTWVGDILLFPNDPLGRHGPHLQDFLRFPNPPQ